MFSQFRQAVENLAPLPRTSLDGQPADARRDSSLSRSNSLDASSPMSSSQLAESALNNLRKSLTTQRSANTGSPTKNPSHAPQREGRTKSRLEDRLRAATSAISEPVHVSEARKSSPSKSSIVSVHPLSAEDTSLSNTALSEEDVTVPPTDSPGDNSIINQPKHSSDDLQTYFDSGEKQEGMQDSSSATESLSNSPNRDPEPTKPSGVGSADDSSTIQLPSSPFDTTEEAQHTTDQTEDLSQPPSSTGTGVVVDESIPTAALQLNESFEDAQNVHADLGSSEPSEATLTAVLANETRIEELQEKLKQVEQRFSDISTSFKRLQEEKQAADLVLRELTSLKSVHDASALQEYFSGLTSKTEVYRDEITRLNEKLETREGILEKLRDTHRQESSSQALQIEKLQTQLAEAEALVKAAQSADSQAEEAAASRKAEIEHLQRELERTKVLAKEEEEKRVKAISLLKTVRQKLVKAEKEREDALSTTALLQEKESGEKEKEQTELTRLRSELDVSNLEKEKALTTLKAQFDRELAGFKDRSDKEIEVLKDQNEAQLTTLKNVHAQDNTNKETQIRSLQQSLNQITTDKNTFFDDLQLRQAELESAQSHLESLESQNTELQYQLRELGDRHALLQDDFAEAQRNQETRLPEPTTSSDEVARLVSAVEMKYESKLFDLKKNLDAIEKERNDSEANWSLKLRDKSKEVEELRRVTNSVTQIEGKREEAITELKAHVVGLEQEQRLAQEQLQELRQINASLHESEKSWKSQEQDSNVRLATLENLIEEGKQRESQLRAGNKTLREELRKVQSSAALLERQRNPGVGYWTSRPTENNSTGSQLSVDSTSSTSRTNTPDQTSTNKKESDEEVNLEYLRNVILQFLEHKEMRWIELCKLLISKQPPSQTQEIIEVDLSNSVLVLCRSYPGDPDLQDYLKYAIREGTLSIATFVATLLQAARSSDLHAPATLDMLCRTALDEHYCSRLPPIGSMVAYNASTVSVLGVVQDALALLRTAHSLPLSHFHQLTTSASELVILLLSCVSDMSQVSTAQAVVYFADANDILQNFELGPDVRQVLETFVLSLSLLIGDDAKTAREAQMLHPITFAISKGNIHGTGSETDIITFSLFLHHIVSCRAQKFGVGDNQTPVALLLALFRWTAWSPVIFYTQLFLSAFTCLSQSASKALIWKAFIIGRLPRLLVMFEAAVNADGATSVDWKRALQSALQTNMRQAELISCCDNAISLVNPTQEDAPLRSFLRDLLQSLVLQDLIPLTFATGIDLFVSNDDMPRLKMEAQDCGLELEAYIEFKLNPDTNIEELSPWIDRVLHDDTSHNVFSTIIFQRFTKLATTFDVDALSHLCKVLYTYERVLDIMTLHITLSDLVFRALFFLDQYDCETVGDPQTAVSHLGDVVIFTDSEQLEGDTYTSGNRILSPAYLKSTDTVYPLDALSNEENQAFTAWFKALFDSGSEGIEDSILRSTQPKVLLKISATLFLQAILRHMMQKIDKDTLNNGVSYFTGPLLSWTLVGIIRALAKDIMHQKVFNTPNVIIRMEVLQTLLLSPSCPRPVLQLCAPMILTLLGLKKNNVKLSALPNLDVTALRSNIGQALGVQAEAAPGVAPEPYNGRISWETEPRQLIQLAFNMARAGKAPSIDVEHCLKVVSPTAFLHLLWSELAVCASVGEMEISRRIATFILTMPRSSSTPPLLPVFLHVVTPSLIFAMDQQQTSEQTMKVELLVTVISSALTAALHLELGIRPVPGEPQFLLGQSSSGMARKLADDLRKGRDRTSRMVRQKLAASLSFAANIAVSINELG
ncbi:hypothetical protein H0H92_002584 [Tricholoma furcatifolium]|nr:hypothetical protein H0H92_002584 [Tricholoma furcatifolium]